MPVSRQSDSFYEQARSPEPIEPPPPPPPPRHPLRRSVNDRRGADAAVQDMRDFVAEASELGAVAARAAPSARDGYAPDYERREPRAFERQRGDEDMRLPDEFQEPMLEPSFTAEEEVRPAPKRGRQPPPPPPVMDDEVPAKRRSLRPQRSFRELIKGGVVLLVVAALGGVLLWQWPNMVAAYQKMRTPSVTEVREVPATATRNNKISDRIEPGVQPGQGTGDTPPGTAPGAAVAQKVVLYEEDPADPNGKRFVGSAIWRTETISPGPGQPPELAIRADVDIPDRKLAMTWSLRRNTDKSLPASHTVEITFKLPSDFPSGGISNVPGILMKQAEQTRGVPLAGLAVKVTSGFFLIGLSSSDCRPRAQSATAQGARLVRYSGGLQQQPPRHPGDRKGHARRPRVRRGLQGLEAVGRVQHAASGRISVIGRAYRTPSGAWPSRRCDTRDIVGPGPS